MDRNHLYLFANYHPEGIDDIEWKRCLGNVNRRFNIKESKSLASEPAQICSEWTERKNLFSNSKWTIVSSSVLLVRLGKSNSTAGSCMYSFRAFELNQLAKPPKYTMLYTGNFVYDHEVEESVRELVKENGTPFSLVYFDDTWEVDADDAAEEGEEPQEGRMW